MRIIQGCLRLVFSVRRLIVKSCMNLSTLDLENYGTGWGGSGGLNKCLILVITKVTTWVIGVTT